jgi:hypothetical protein
MMPNGRVARDFVVRVVSIAIFSLTIIAAGAEGIGNSPSLPPAAGSNNSPQQKSEAAEAWDAVKDTTNPALLEAFIKRYRTTFFADLATARLGELKAAAARRALPPDDLRRRVAPMPTDGARESAILYEEELSNPQGRQYAGSVVWRAVPVSADARPREPAVRADIDVPSRGLRMTMLFKRNLDPTLPASHVAELTFQLSPKFEGGGILNAPGLLMKVNQQAKGTPLAGISVKVRDGSFLVGLSNTATDRVSNMNLLLNRSWIDVPIIYTIQRRAILAIEKGVSGEQVFQTVFGAWTQYPQAAQPGASTPYGDGGKADPR